MRQWNKETIEEQLKLHKKQNKDDRYNYMNEQFNALWYCWELEKYTIEKGKEIERLNNIIKPKEVNYNYLKLLFEKKDKEEVIKSYVYKCEQLEKLYKSYEEKEIEVMKKDNIIDELEKLIDSYELGKYDYEIPVVILKEKLKELKEGK